MLHNTQQAADGWRQNYRPALGGVYLALLNSGLATNLAANSLVLVTW